MNNQDRKMLARVEEVARYVGSLTPQNPADVAAIARNLPVATKASKAVAKALSALRLNDLEWAEDYLTEAERIIADAEKRAA
ncbi:hypothetical protein ACIBCR_15580 [Micromonospora echinospora]|uniref:hypothetical protein n=1 Tax=Micromonospora echinospora TaxID=1877 RepID=UPI0037B4617B